MSLRYLIRVVAGLMLAVGLGALVSQAALVGTSLGDKHRTAGTIVAFHAANGAHNASGTTQSVTLPAVSDGDFVGVLLCWVNNSALTTATGYTLEASSLSQQATLSSEFAWHIWHTGDTTTPSFTIGTAAVASYLAFSYSGTTATPIDGVNVSTTNAVTTLSAGSVSPAQSADMLLIMFDQSGSGDTFSAPSLGTSRSSFNTTGPSLTLLDAQLSASGATGAQTITSSSTGRAFGTQIALIP